MSGKIVQVIDLSSSVTQAQINALLRDELRVEREKVAKLLAATKEMQAEYKKELGKLEDWITAAVQSNREVDAYLRSVDMSLPKTYGMPIDGVRMVIQGLQMQLAEALKYAPKADMPSEVPDAEFDDLEPAP